MISIGWEEKVYPATKIAIVVDGLAAEGIPLTESLRRTSISPDDLRSPTTQVSVNQVIEAYRNAIELSRVSQFAFNTGLKTHVSSYGMYGFAILSSMNFRQTMQFAVRYHQLATPLVKLRFLEEAGHVKFEAPRPEKEYNEALGCPVAFGQSGNRILFDATWLNGSPVFGNEISYASVVSLCDDLQDRLQNRIGVAGKVRTFLLATLGRHANLDDVATHFDTPVRTLRRKLREEGTSFRELLDQLRAEVAVKYLRDTAMTIDDIAHALGFSETANFRHAFQRWNRASPQEYRRGLLISSAMRSRRSAHE